MLPKLSLLGLVRGSNCLNLNRNLCALRLAMTYFHATNSAALGLTWTVNSRWRHMLITSSAHVLFNFGNCALFASALLRKPPLH